MILKDLLGVAHFTTRIDIRMREHNKVYHRVIMGERLPKKSVYIDAIRSGKLDYIQKKINYKGTMIQGVELEEYGVDLLAFPKALLESEVISFRSRSSYFWGDILRVDVITPRDIRDEIYRTLRGGRQNE